MQPIDSEEDVDLGLSGKRALVGGGAGGIGAGIAGVLAAEGARLMLVGRTANTLDARAAALGASRVVADLAAADGPGAAVAAAVDEFGGLDVYVMPFQHALPSSPSHRFEHSRCRLQNLTQSPS